MYAPRNDGERSLPKYLNQPAIKTALGMTAPLPEWALINEVVRDRWQNNGEWTWDARPQLEEAMAADRNLRVLLYAGDTDLVANFLGIKAIAKSTLWEGRAAFNDRARRDDKVSIFPVPSLRFWILSSHL